MERSQRPFSVCRRRTKKKGAGGSPRVDGDALIDYSLYNAETILGGTEP